MNAKKALESRIRGWLPQEVTLPKANISTSQPTQRKSAILFISLVVSVLPLIDFLVFDYPYAKDFIWEMFNGQAVMRVDAAKDSFQIFSSIVTGFVSFPLSHVIIVVAATIVFFASLALVIIMLYRRLKQVK